MKHTYFRYVNRSSVHDIKSIVIALMVFRAKRFGPMAGTLNCLIGLMDVLPTRLSSSFLLPLILNESPN